VVSCGQAGIPEEAWSGVDDFSYQLQRARRDAIAESGFDMVVVSTAVAGSSPTAIPEMKEAAGGDLLVLAYLSIGQAEQYRPYFQPEWLDHPPGWLDDPDEDWRGSYWVRYWEPAWQEIVYGTPDSMLDEIVAWGFDGVYLDRVDTYRYYLERDGRQTAAAEMVDFVIDLAAHARETRPGFGVFPQNAEELGLEFPELMEVSTGIGVEDLYYGYPWDNQASPAGWTAEREMVLDQWVEAGKLVLTIDYTIEPEQINDAYRRSLERGYVPYVTDRGLDRLRVNPGFEPTLDPSEWDLE
jgi:cysteinyl-tRNA synthetase